MSDAKRITLADARRLALQIMEEAEDTRHRVVARDFAEMVCADCVEKDARIAELEAEVARARSDIAELLLRGGPR